LLKRAGMVDDKTGTITFCQDQEVSMKAD